MQSHGEAFGADENVPEGTTQWSALADGELEGPEIAALMQQLRQDERPREAWSTYHLIGDVLRSSDLARPTDDALVLRVRAALAREPVVLAPVPTRATPPASVAARALRWRAPAAAVAGVALVAGTWGVLNLRDPSREGGAGVGLAALNAQASAPQVSSLAMQRDAQLDRYLQAHQEFAGATALGASSGLVRATARQPDAR